MIHITKSFLVTEGTAPFSYSWSSGCNVSFTDPSGSTAGQTNEAVIQTTVSFSTELDLENCSDLTLTITDSTGCVKAFPVSVQNPCVNMTTPSGIQNQDGLTFWIDPQGGTPPYTYTWVYDTTLGVDPNGSDGSNGTIDLQFVNPPNEAYIGNITVITEDANGCSETDSTSISFCQPNASSQSILVNCARYTYSTGPITLAVSSLCSGNTIDWSTVNFSSAINDHTNIANTDITITNTSNIATLDIPSSVPPGDYYINWTVETASGIPSTQGTIYFTVPECPEQVQQLQISTANSYERPSDGASSVVTNIEDHVTPATDVDIDWTTFTVVNGPDNGSNSGTWSAAARTYTYTINDQSGVDKVDWTLDDTDGNQSSRGTIIYNLDAVTAPVANADTADCVCGTTQSINVLSNDTGDINNATLTITQAPTNGTASVGVETGNAYRINYTPNAGYNGSDTIKYKVFSPDGVASNEGTVTVTVICAGNATSIAYTCENT